MKRACIVAVRYGFEPSWDNPKSAEFAGPCRCGARETCIGCGELHTLVERCAPCAMRGQLSPFERLAA